MKKIAIASLLISLLLITAQAQLIIPPLGANKKAWVGERIGITDVSINYDRPGVKGREGKIWGGVIHKGFIDFHWGDTKAAPWRAGANENTTIEFSDSVKIEGRPLPAGRYALFIAYDQDESIIIFSRNSTSWGSFFYDEKEDALRVKVKPLALEKNVEWLKYEFTDQTTNSATVALQWERILIPFKIEVDYMGLQLASFRRELRSGKAFAWTNWNQAASFCADNSINLEEGLKWAENSISLPYFGNKNFLNLSTKARILNLLGRNAEADSVMKEAVALGDLQQVNDYALRLLELKKNKEGLDVFKINYDKNPNSLIALLGLVKGYSAYADHKNALKYAKMALPHAPDKHSRSEIEEMIKKLQVDKNGKK